MFLSAQKNRLNETVLLSTHNICFGFEIRIIFFVVTHTLSYTLRTNRLDHSLIILSAVTLISL